jgi:hypothetical protein
MRIVIQGSQQHVSEFLAMMMNSLANYTGGKWVCDAAVDSFSTVTATIRRENQ